MPCTRRLIIAEQPVNPDHSVIFRLINQDEMIKERIEPVTFQPRRVIDQRSIATQFLDKDLVAQALRRAQFLGRVGQLHTELGGAYGHRPCLWGLRRLVGKSALKCNVPAGRSPQRLLTFC